MSESPPAVPPRESRGSGGCSIVAMDDENDVLLLIRTALESAGHTVYTATNGSDGLELVAEVKPHLIILDIMMPEMDGLEVLRRLKENDKTATIPIIMLTALSDKSKIKEALDQGAEYYIVKPFEYTDLLAKVDIALKTCEEI